MILAKNIEKTNYFVIFYFVLLPRISQNCQFLTGGGGCGIYC